jgi:2',3'-cyclic-nucleotide 2'-phosphodiesterase (5'-nucleotidase family)
MSSKVYKIPVFAAAAMLWMSCQSHYALVKASRSEYHIDSTITTDSAVLKTYLPYKQQMDAQMNGVIGQCAKELPKTGGTETLLGNFFADAVTAESMKIEPAIDFAMPTTKGGLRNNLPKGNITLSNMFELMPFENELVLLKLKGTDVEQLLNFIAASDGEPVSNIKLKIKDKQAYDVLIKGQPFDKTKTYLVLTSDYIANGGDNAKGLANPIEKRNLGLLVRNALVNYVKSQTAAGKLIDANLDGRITKN